MPTSQGGLAALVADAESDPNSSRTAKSQPTTRVLRVEVNGLVHDWFDVDEMGDFIRSAAFNSTLRENVSRYFGIPVETQAIYDEDGLLTTSADFSRALQRISPKLYVYDVHEMDQGLKERTVEELEMIDQEVEQSWKHFGARSGRGRQTGPPIHSRSSGAEQEGDKVSFAEAGYAEGGSGGTPADGPSRQPRSSQAGNVYAFAANSHPDGGDLDSTIVPQYKVAPSTPQKLASENATGPPRNLPAEAEAFSLLAPAATTVTGSASVSTLPATPTTLVQNGISPRQSFSNGSLRRSESACTGLAFSEVGTSTSTVRYFSGGSGPLVQVSAPEDRESWRRSSKADAAPSLSPSRPVTPVAPTTPPHWTAAHSARQSSPPHAGQQGYFQGATPSRSNSRPLARASVGTKGGQPNVTVVRTSSVSQLLRAPSQDRERSSTPRRVFAQTPVVARSTTHQAFVDETRGAARHIPMQVATGLPMQGVSRDSTPRRSHWPPQPCWPGGQATPGRAHAVTMRPAAPVPAGRHLAGATQIHHRSPSPVVMGTPRHFLG